MLLLFAGCERPEGISEAGPSLQAGSTVTLPPWDAGVPALTLPVPDGYKTRTEKGRDFDIHFLEPASSSEARGSIYVGHNPGLLHRQLTVTGEVSERSEKIGNELVKVYDFSIEGPRTVREATLATVFADRAGDKKLAELRVHISVTGSTREKVEALWEYVSRVQRQ